MRSLNQLQLTAAGLVLIVGTGCTMSPNVTTPVAWHASGFIPVASVQCFESYEAAFRYIAQGENLPADSRTLFRLAADSTIDRPRFEQTGDLAIIRAEYYGDSRWGIRGAHGQGRYYAFQTDGHRWRLVGILHGNGYRWQNVGDQICLVTRWHISASESTETIYTWNQNDGRFE